MQTRRVSKGWWPIYLTVLAVLFLAASAHSKEERFSRRTPLVIAVEKVGPMVVNLQTREAAPPQRNPFRSFGNDFFDRFFRDFFPPSSPQNRSLGSGVIINPKGYILTNEHVVANAASVQVALIDNRVYDARLVGADPKSDIAIIKIDSDEPLPFVEMGRSDDLMIGERVIAIGNPFGLQHTVTSGIISALNRTIRAGDQVYHDFIQVDASINPGNSGGPLLNINGELIGINTAIYQKAEGIGFAIPIDNAKRIVNELIRFGKVRRGWMGVSVQNMTPELLRYFHLDPPHGVLAVKVMKGSPADLAGIKRRDIVVAIDGHVVHDKPEYLERVGSYAVGNTVRITVLRDGKKRTFPVKVRAIPKSLVVEFTLHRLGLRVKNISGKLTRKYRLHARKGVVVTGVVEDGPGGRIGISPGDVIRQVNQASIEDEKDFNKAIIESGNRESTLLLVQRGRYGYYVTLEP